MNNDSHKLRHAQKEEISSELRGEQKQEVVEFSSVDELLQHDATNVQVPPGIAARLNDSIKGLPVAVEKPWWKKIFPGA